MKKHRLAVAIIAAALGIASTAALASPEDDYKMGVRRQSEGDQMESLTFFQKAADKGHAKAAAEAGVILEMAQEPERAMKYFQIAHDKGEPAGSLGLASMSITGDAGKHDFAKAVALLESAVAKGHEESMHTLATTLWRMSTNTQKGYLGTPAADPKRTLELLKSSAALGYLQSNRALVEVYSKGLLGEAANPAEAARRS